MARWFDWVLDAFGLKKKRPKVQPAPAPVPTPTPVPEPEPVPTPVPTPTTTTLRITVNGVEQPLVYPWRVEWDGDNASIIWGGDIFDASPKHHGAYRAELIKNGSVIASLDVPVHYWGCCVPFRSTKPQQLFTIAELIAQRKIPPFKNIPIADAEIWPTPPYTPMGTSGLPPGNFGATGEAPTIGFFNEWDARFVGTGEGLSDVENLADAAFTFPVALTKDGKAVDWFEYPQARTYGGHSTPAVSIGPPRTDTGPNVPFITDGGMIAHMPSLSYLRAVLFNRVDDRRQVERFANYFWVWGMYRWLNPNDIQVRGVAWTLGLMIRAWALAPVEATDGFLPKSYWERALSEIAAKFKEVWIQQPGYNHKAHLHSISNANAPYQESYLTFVLNVGYWMGLTVLGEMLAFMMGGVIARNSGLSGWPQDISTGVPGQFNVWAKKLDGTPVEVWNTADEIIPAKDFAELWEWNKAREAQVTRDPSKPHAIGTDNYYLSYERANLIMFRDYNKLSLPSLAEAYGNVVPNVIPQGRRHAIAA